MTTVSTLAPITPEDVRDGLSHLESSQSVFDVYESPELLEQVASVMTRVRAGRGPGSSPEGVVRQMAMQAASLRWSEGSAQFVALATQVERALMAMLAVPTQMTTTVSADPYRVACAVADSMDCTDMMAASLIPAVESALRAQGVTAAPVSAPISRPTAPSTRIDRPVDHGLSGATCIFYAWESPADSSHGTQSFQAEDWSAWHDVHVVSWSAIGRPWIERVPAEAHHPWTADDMPDGTLLLYVDGAPAQLLHASTTPVVAAEAANEITASHVAVVGTVGRDR